MQYSQARTVEKEDTKNQDTGTPKASKKQIKTRHFSLSEFPTLSSTCMWL